jgi:hypothetical protein
MFMKKKGQEEIVGFVLIVVIIAVVFVIFLGIKLRNPEPAQRESEVLYQFIESSMEQTTDCVIRENGKNVALNELIGECYSFNNNCLNGRTSCDIATDTFKELLKATWKVGPQEVYKGYEITAEYHRNSSSVEVNDEVFSIIEGNCSNSYIGNSYFIPEFPGNIIVQARVCP